MFLGSSSQLPLNPRAIKQGVNQLKLKIARRGASAKNQLIVERIKIDVRYQHK